MEKLNKEKISKLDQLLNEEIFIINIGLDLFAQTFSQLEVPYIAIDWQPPAAGDQDLNDILSALK